MLKPILVSAALAVGALLTTGCAVTDKQSSVGQYVDDSTITARVKTRLAQDKQVSASRIEVETLNGTVQLSGFATSDTEKLRAAQLAREVPNVNNVRNDIIIRPPTN